MTNKDIFDNTTQPPVVEPATGCSDESMPDLRSTDAQTTTSMSDPTPEPETVYSGVNAHLGVPPNIKSFSWGALFLGWLWGVFNGNYWSLVLLPINITVQVLLRVFSSVTAAEILSLLSLALQIVLGFTGYRTAWKTKKYESVEEFVKTQRKWNIAGFIIFGVLILFYIYVYFC